mmetsp:Transcript_26977/g.88531  ORF Transcript_26977/g.88531 Transcript_26977/m.88531 type:complete len:178 (+) Transcript_26977:23-556(+)
MQVCLGVTTKPLTPFRRTAHKASARVSCSARSGASAVARPGRGATAQVASTQRSVRASAADDEQPVSSTAAEDDELPPWVRREMEKELQAGQPQDLPYGVYLLLSSIIIIAMIGTIFEFAYKNPLFGVIQPDTLLYNIVCGVFVFTALPSATFLWIKATKAANEEADRQDRLDGYLD